jgi:hypothetical protein
MPASAVNFCPRSASNLHNGLRTMPFTEADG